MGGIATAAMSALEPLVGSMVASTCVRATALSLGKVADELDAADWPKLEESIRRLLGPIAPVATVSQIVSDIAKEVR